MQHFGAIVIVSAILGSSVSARGQGIDVPLRRWIDPVTSTGIDFNRGLGTVYGGAVGDYDADGWPDVVLPHLGNLWRNVGGRGWSFVRDLRPVYGAGAYRYSASFGDADQDGVPEIVVDPYSGNCLALLRCDRDAPVHVDHGALPGVLSSRPCGVQGETICWADVDGDGWLDFFLSTYPSPQQGGTNGNYFYRNLGPAPGRVLAFAEVAVAAKLRTQTWGNRPEGAYFADVDRDGDLDLFSNGTLYQNVSTPGVPSFVPLPPTSSGILSANALDEGALLCDYDMDGDQDLILQEWNPGNRLWLWENRGDGTFFDASGAFEATTFGNTGLSVADFDHDGDLDFTNYRVFRRNRILEDGTRRIRPATHTVTEFANGSPSPCWVDWDKDGDLDCIVTGHAMTTSPLYENTTYGPTTPLAAKRHVRVRIARDGVVGDRGLEVEYGATAELVLVSPRESVRRVQTTSSAGGYINQSEYTLHFALPASVPAEQLVFDVVVDFPGLPEQGLRRVDKSVNPALGGIRLSALADREITVLRSGRVVLNGVMAPPLPGRPLDLRTTLGPMPVASASGTLPAPTPAPDAFTWVGLDFDSERATASARVREVLVDGELGAPLVTPVGEGNLLLLDVTDPRSPALVASHAYAGDPRNRRHHVPVDWVLPRGRSWVVLARVRTLRWFAAPPDDLGALHVRGGIQRSGRAPWRDGDLAGDPARNALRLRYGLESAGSWVDFGQGVFGTSGAPKLVGTGNLAPGAAGQLLLSKARPGSQAVLVAGAAPAFVPLFGGVLVPFPEAVLTGIAIDTQGQGRVGFVWPFATTAFALYFQAFVADPAAAYGVAVSNAVQAAVR